MSSLSDIIAGWDQQNAIFEAPGVCDQFGNRAPGASLTYPAIIVQQVRMVQDRMGKQVVSNCQLILEGAPSVPGDGMESGAAGLAACGIARCGVTPTAGINPESVITFPDGSQSRIINIVLTPDFDGNICATEVYT